MKNNNKKLVYLVTNYQVSIWPLCMLAEMMLYDFKKLAGKNYKGEMIGEWENGTNRWAVDQEYDKGIPEKIFKKISKNREWAQEKTQDLIISAKQLVKFSKAVFNSDLSVKTDEEIYKFYMDYRREFINMYIYAWFPNSLESERSYFTKKLEDYLRHTLKKIKKEKEVGKFLSILTTPIKQTTRIEEKKELLEIISLINRHKKIKDFFMRQPLKIIEKSLHSKAPKIDKIITSHYKKYLWLPFDYDGPAWDKKNFLNEIKKSIKNRVNPEMEINKIKDEKEKIKRLQREMAKDAGLDKNFKHAYYFALASELMFLKEYRKDALFKSYFYIEKLITEIGRRLNLSPRQIKHILPQEMGKILLEKDYAVLKELNERINFSVVLYMDNDRLDDNSIKIFTGDKAKEIVAQKIKQDKKFGNVKEIKGQTAFTGYVKGKVKLILTTDDMAKMKSGDILVSSATNPNLLPAIKKASAMITDKGGITCHAAIVAREMGKPCIIGTGNATKILKDGDFVEVDAENGVVRKL